LLDFNVLELGLFPKLECEIGDNLLNDHAKGDVRSKIHGLKDVRTGVDVGIEIRRVVVERLEEPRFRKVFKVEKESGEKDREQETG